MGLLEAIWLELLVRFSFFFCYVKRQFGFTKTSMFHTRERTISSGSFRWRSLWLHFQFRATRLVSSPPFLQDPARLLSLLLAFSVNVPGILAHSTSNESPEKGNRSSVRFLPRESQRSPLRRSKTRLSRSHERPFLPLFSSSLNFPLPFFFSCSHPDC